MHKGTRRERIRLDRARLVTQPLHPAEEKLLFIKFYFHCLTLTKARDKNECEEN